jgi:hypothetical protein
LLTRQLQGQRQSQQSQQSQINGRSRAFGAPHFALACCLPDVRLMFA